MALFRKEYKGAAVATTLNTSITNSTLTVVLAAATGWPTGSPGPFVLVINRGGSTEEKVLCDSRTSTSCTVNASGRGYDGTSAASHEAGEAVEHCLGAIDLNEANNAVAQTIGAIAAKGDLLAGSAANTLTKLTVGSNNTVLMADSAQATGVKWAAQSNIDHGTLGGLSDDDHTQYQLKSVLTTKGDLYTATAASTVARTGVGSNGQVLTADSAQTNGIKWAALPAADPTATTINYTGTATNDVVKMKVTGDSAERLTLNANGLIELGPGNAATDTFLYRVDSGPDTQQLVVGTSATAWAGRYIELGLQKVDASNHTVYLLADDQDLGGGATSLGALTVAGVTEIQLQANASPLRLLSGDSIIADAPTLIQPVIASAPTLTADSQLGFYLDESGLNLVAKIQNSAGATRYAVVPYTAAATKYPVVGTEVVKTSDTGSVSSGPASTEAWSSGGGDFVIAAALNDLVMVYGSFLWDANATVDAYFDLKVTASGKFLSSGTTTSDTHGMAQGFGPTVSGSSLGPSVAFAVPYVVPNDAISGGNVTFRPSIGASAASRKILGSTGHRAKFRAVNLGPSS